MGKNHGGKSIKGSITKRLLEKFGKDSPGWFPERPAEHGLPKGGKLPKGVKGKSLGRGADRKKGK